MPNMDPGLVCRICGLQADGTHFGVVTCRACAVFFRRSVTSKWIKRKCMARNEDKLVKCIESGMDSSKFQYNRDTIPKKTKTRPIISYYVGRPEFLIFFGSNVTTQNTFIDAKNLVFEASRHLVDGCQSPIHAKNQLKKLALGIKLMQFDTQNIKFYSNFGKSEFMDTIEYYFVTVAKWIAHFDEFRKLEQSLQMKMLQAIWHVWSKVHKCASTALYRKSNPNAKLEQKIFRNICMDGDLRKFDTSWMSDYSTDHVIRFMLIPQMYDFEIIEALGKLGPTDIELTFIFAQLCFEYAGKRFQGDILKITDHFQQVLSNDLHHYYTNDQRRNRYSLRLADLMKVNIVLTQKVQKFLLKKSAF